MANNVTADELITHKHKRNFIQWDGARPDKPVSYAGQDAQYIAIEGVSVPESGGVDPIFVPDPRRIGKYKLVGRSISPPDLASATVMMRERHGAIPRQLQKQGCTFNLYELTGKCQDLSDFLRGWSDYILVYSAAIVDNKDLGTRSSFDSDDPVEDSLPITLADVYPVGALGFGQEAATQIDREVADVVYGTPSACYCDDPSEFIYAATKSSGSGSPGIPSEVIYSVDGGANWSQVNIDGIGATENALAIDIVGNYLVVLGLDALYYAELNQDTGAPGTFTKVSTGFVAAGSPNDLYVVSPREVWFAGDGGYIYKSTDITAGVSVVSAGDATSENLQRIHGADETIVAVGAAGAIIKSANRGVTWATTTITPTSATVQAISVLDDRRYWVGTADGYVYYTLNGGETWGTLNFSGSGAGAVYDIVFVNSEVGYFSHSTATPDARLFATWNGGADWTNNRPRILNLPTFDRTNRIAVPDTDAGIAANNVALAGLAADGTDGILLIGAAARV